MAMATPLSLQSSAGSSFAQMMGNPFGTLFHGFGAAFSSRASAAVTAQDDAFGVTQYAYDADELRPDAEAYWDAHCSDKESQAYQNDEDFKNNNWNQDAANHPDTGKDGNGMPVNSSVNPCLLIKASVGSGGATSDSDLLTDSDKADITGGAPSSTTPDPATAAPTGTAPAGTTPQSGGIMVLFNEGGLYDRAMLSVDVAKGSTVGGVPNTDASCEGTVISKQTPPQLVKNFGSASRLEVPCTPSSFFVNFFKPGQALTDRGPQNNNGRVSPSITPGYCTYVHHSGVTRVVAISADGTCPDVNESAQISQLATKLTAKYTPSPIIIGKAYTYEHELSLASGDPMSAVECAGDVVITHIPDGGVGPRNYPILYNPDTQTCAFKQLVTAAYSATLSPKKEQLHMAFNGNAYLAPSSVTITHERIR
jgi:hypothetical protein